MWWWWWGGGGGGVPSWEKNPKLSSKLTTPPGKIFWIPR